MHKLCLIVASLALAGSVICQPDNKATAATGRLHTPEPLSAKSLTEVIPNSRGRLYRIAEFPGGPGSLASFINENLEYPDLAIRHGIEGFVILRLHIAPTGRILSCEMERSIGFGCEEALRKVVDQMPPWKATTINGIPVRSQIRVPVWFRLW